MVSLKSLSDAKRHPEAVGPADNGEVFAFPPGLALTNSDVIAGFLVGNPPDVVSRLVEILGHVERNRFEERTDTPVHSRSGHAGSQHCNGIVCTGWTGDNESWNVSKDSD